MRTSDVKTTIVSTLEAITPDGKAHARDTFRHVDSAGRYSSTNQQAGRLPDRTFHVSLSSVPARADLLTMDAFHVEYLISIFYTAGQAQVEDRIGMDAERVTHALALAHTGTPDLFSVTVTPGMVDEFEQIIEAQLSARATYRLTGVS